MIKLIGFKRIVLLTCLAALNLSLFGLYFFSIGPMLTEVTAQRDGLNAQVAELVGKIDNIKSDVAFVKDNTENFNNLQAQGFFWTQDRLIINRSLEALRNKSGVSTFSFSVGDVTEIPNATAAEINHRLISSRIKVEKIGSATDANIYALAQNMKEGFPAAVRIQNLSLTRTRDVNEQALKDLAQGMPVNFIDATLEFDWITMVPKPAENTATPAGEPAGFRGQ